MDTGRTFWRSGRMASCASSRSSRASRISAATGSGRTTVRIATACISRRPPDFDHSVLPADHGLIVATVSVGKYLRHPPSQPLNAARRKSVIMMFARLAASRLQAGLDPEFAPF